MHKTFNSNELKFFVGENYDYGGFSLKFFYHLGGIIFLKLQPLKLFTRTRSFSER